MFTHKQSLSCSLLSPRSMAGRHSGSTLLTQNHAQEGLSRAYLHALAAEARVLVEMNGTFDYGLDGYFDLVKILPMRHKDGSVVRDHSPALYPIYFQLKSSINWKIENDHIVWSMESRAYNKIIAAGTPVAPVILILLCLPSDLAKWSDFSEGSMMLQRSCYWASVTGEPITNLKSKKKLFIPRKNLLNPAALTTMLEGHRNRITAAGG